MSVNALRLVINLICFRIQTLQTPLGDVNPNSCQRLRSGLTITEAALAQAVKRP